MIDFQIVENGKSKFITWAKLCEFSGIKYYRPSTPELASVKMELAERWSLDPDSVIVRLNRQPIL